MKLTIKLQSVALAVAICLVSVSVRAENALLPFLEQDGIFYIMGPVDVGPFQTVRIRGLNLNREPIVAQVAVLNAGSGQILSFFERLVPSGEGFVFEPELAPTDRNGGPQGGVFVMYRRGYTKGCSATNDGQRRFCPNDLSVLSLQVLAPDGTTSLLVPAVQSAREAGR